MSSDQVNPIDQEFHDVLEAVALSRRKNPRKVQNEPELIDPAAEIVRAVEAAAHVGGRRDRLAAQLARAEAAHDVDRADQLRAVLEMLERRGFTAGGGVC